MPSEPITCIICPMGCQINARIENGTVTSVQGNACKRGEAYAYQESIAPLRMVTAVVPVTGSHMPVSVKTASPIPKAKITECMNEIDRLRLSAPISAGQVIICDVAGTGVAVIATKNIQ